MSETSTTEMGDYLTHQHMIRSLELRLELLEYGLALPGDEYAITQTKALLEKARRG